MTLTEAIRKQADEIHEMTMDEVKRLPNMQGRIASAMVDAHGFYTYKQGGKRHLIIKKYWSETLGQYVTIPE